MGKWDKRIADLPRKYSGEDEDDPRAQEKIDAVKKAILACRPEQISNFDSVQDLLNELAFMCKAVEARLTIATNGNRYASSFAQGYREARRIKEALEEHVKTVKRFMNAYTQLTVEQLEVEGTTSLKFEDGASVRAQYEPYASVQDKEAFRQWCLANGYEREMTLLWQTMNGIAKDRLEEGEPVPNGVKLWNKPKLVFTKAPSEK